MLTVSSTAGGGAGYYMAKDNYYFLGSMEASWMGKAAELLGLEGPVDAKTFDDALAGFFPQGVDLSRMSGGQNIHRPGYDLTLSAPKSISVLGVVLGDSRILEAHQRAVGVAMGEIERLASTRVMVDGVSQTEMTGKLLAAAFHHDTSRELDPQLHTHLIVMNLTEYLGEWKTLSSDKVGNSGFIENVYALQVALGKIYRNELRQAVEEMGFRTVVTGKNDLWEIEGVPVEIFSQRTQQIREAVGDGASLKSRDVAALDTRKAKQKDPDRVELLTDWMNRLEQEGFDIGAFRQEAETRLKTMDSDRAVRPETTPDDVRQAVSLAISQLSEKRTRFTYSDVLNRTLNSLDAREQVAVMARSAIESAIESQQLIPLDREKGVFTSSIHLLDELSLQQLAGEMKSTVVISGGALARSSSSVPVMQQIEADRPALAIVSQPGGAGGMRESVLAGVQLAQSQGREVVVLATDRSSERWLAEQPGLADKLVTLKGLSESALPENSTLIVAGAEKLSVRDALTVTDQALRAQSQLLLMDSGGRSGTGNALQTLEAAGVTRYRTETERTVAVSVVSEPDKRQRYAALARDYVTMLSQGENVVAQASGEREQQTLTAALRQMLQEKGLLGGKTASVDTLVPQWLDSKNRRQLDTYREGMVLEQRSADSRAPQRYTIDRVSAETRTLMLVGEDGQRQGMKLSQVDSSWSLYRSQSVDIAEGEKLTWLARQGKQRAGDSVTVTAVRKNSLVVEHDGQKRVIRTDEPLKAGYGYVTSPGKRVSEQGTVLAAVSGRDTGATMLNTLARSGEHIQLYTPLANDEAERRLSRSPLYRTALAQVNPQNGELADAMSAAQDALMSPAEKAVRQAVTLTQGSEVVFSRPDVLANALPLHASLRKDDVDRELARQVQTGELIPVPGPKGTAQQLYVTAASYEAEKRVIRLVVEGLDTQSSLLSHADPALFAGLTAGQQQASSLILESTDRFIGIQGYAGVGKTTQLKTVLAALETLPAEQRPDVVGLAPTHRAVGEMADVGVKAQTLASFLMDVERRIQGGETPDFSKTLFLVDESSMVGNRDMADAMGYIAAGGGRAVLSGDRDQLLPVDNGAPFTLLQERSPLDTAIMQDIVRQSPALKPAIESVIARQVPAALDTIRSVTPDTVPRTPGRWSPTQSVVAIPQTKEQKEEQGDRVIQAIVDDFTGRTAEARDNTLIVTQTNADKNAINTAIHAQLQERGELGREVAITVLERVKTQTDRLKSVAGMAAQHGNIALINDRYYTIRAGQDSRQNGYVELVDETGQAQALSAFESSLRDIAVFKPREIKVSVGEKVSFSRPDRERGREANSNWTVTGVTKEGELQLTQGEDVRTLSPNVDLADRHLDYGYAGTAHKAQGASALYVIVLAGVDGGRKALASLRDAYVGLSRVKAHVQVYTDNLGKWLSKVSQPAERQTAHDVLLADSDRQAATAQQLWEKATPLSASALGRALATQLPEAGEARFIHGSRKYPAPHVALPAHDASGVQRAVWLREVQLDGDGRLRGLSDNARLLGSKEATLVIFRQSETGLTRQATDLAEARQLGLQHPGDGIVVVRGESPTDAIMKRLSGGLVLPDSTDISRHPGSNPADTPDPVSLKTPEEQRMAKALAEEARRQQHQEAAPHLPGDPERPDALQQAERAESRALQREAEQSRQQELAGLGQVIQQDRQQTRQRESVTDQLHRVEREIVKEKEIGE
ncbi:conjugative transfer relaxase/helicase TraI [Escherichia coli]|uniref:conjugative transfer relaxase/helicase TraI n=1 Tax=Escherichia coli TaxID=562 RepID=UPI00292C2C72|nr:conjugative transfer relaxase/helicase TraI [Escherichia coli]MDV0509807.1 conjugative transfer relaxase/helicase TraI [Escherichia coli]MDV1491412.1 conjugative transfer relaxase/helicase TraI [Escherichia coli]MDV1512257.1 conjugative transfer relaxase/helicase TraI [Escherichia coli]MDV1602011.1 conjugative transfer relaxase/helicase TraI [Escherichia coli]